MSDRRRKATTVLAGIALVLFGTAVGSAIDQPAPDPDDQCTIQHGDHYDGCVFP